MSLSLAEFMKEASNIIIAHETAQATKHNEARKEELKELPDELAAQEEEIAKRLALVAKARQELAAAKKAGLNGIVDPFAALKRWAEKHKAWEGWEGEVKDPESLPPIGWVRRSRNLSYLYFAHYEQMYSLVKKGKKEVLRGYLGHLERNVEEAEEELAGAQRSYNFYKERYERLDFQVGNFNYELEQLREELTPRTQEDLEDILEDAWEYAAQREEILKLIPDDAYEVQEEGHLNSVTRTYTIKLMDATLHFEVCS